MNKNEGSILKKETIVNPTSTALLRDRYKYCVVLGECLYVLVQYDYSALIVDIRPVERHFGLKSL